MTKNVDTSSGVTASLEPCISPSERLIRYRALKALKQSVNDLSPYTKVIGNTIQQLLDSVKEFESQKEDATPFMAHAERTWNIKTGALEQLANAAMGLAGESGEVVDLLKKNLFHGTDVSCEQIAEELGDVLYYVATIARQVGYTMEEIEAINREKLEIRFPEGFSPEAANRRADEE